MSTQAYDLHANWRQCMNPRDLIAKARKHGGAVTPYGRSCGFRSYIVSWPSEGCEGHLYVVRVQALSREERKRMHALEFLQARGIDGVKPIYRQVAA